MTPLTKEIAATVRVLKPTSKWLLITRTVLRDTTPGKEYHAKLLPKGSPDPDGNVCLEDCATFIDDVGDRVIAHMLPGVFKIVSQEK